MNRKKIVVTKTIDGDLTLPDAILAAGFEPLIEPMLRIEALENDFQTVRGTPLLFTSVHGVQSYAAGTGERGNPVYVVGRMTAEAAKAAGFSTIEAIAPTAPDLAEILYQRTKTGLNTVFYARGEDISFNFKENLREAGLKIEEIIVYKAHPVENLSISLLKSIDAGKIEGVLFFSMRGGQIFADLMEQYGRSHRFKTIKALCLSDSVVKSVSVLPFKHMRAAPAPTREDMIKLIANISVNEDKV